MEKKRRYREIVMLFMRKKDIEGLPTRYKPIKVVTGKYDEENKSFIGDDGNTYSHMSCASEGEIGYGLRCPYIQIHETYNKKTPKESLKAYEREFRFLTFFFGASDSNHSNLYLVGENMITHSRALFGDADISLNIVKNTSNIDSKRLSTIVKNKVIGQDEAIDDIVTTLWKNSHRKNKKNMLLIGPTGVGKTEIIKTIAHELDIPVVIASSSALTKSGYKGESVEDILKRLYNKADGDIGKTQTGIIVLDEIDKLASQEVSGDTISTSGVQEELLKFTEGCEYELDISDDPFEERKITINTEGITFIGMGAFANLDRQNRNKEFNSIGFGARVVEKKDENAFYREITANDITAYGIIAELVGRLPIIIPLNPITEDLLIKIMNNSNTDSLIETKKILADVGIRLKIENPEKVKKKIAKIAFMKNIGVRGLDSVVERTFVKAMKEISQNDGVYSELIIDENTIDDPSNYILVKKDNSKKHVLKRRY